MRTTHRATFDTLIRTSRDIITSLQEPSGAYPASPSFSAYRGYCWFRDGSFIADGVSSVGEVASASAFHDWAAMVVSRHSGRIHNIVKAANAGVPLPDAQMLPARFTFDGESGNDEWWDFQLDGYGTWLWAAATHSARHGINPARWAEAAALTVDYLISSWGRPCYDWWEEHDEAIHGSTLGCIAAGLRDAARYGLVIGERAERARHEAVRITERLTKDAVVDGHLVKWIGTNAVDGSLSALIAPLGVIDPDSELAAGTLRAVTQQLEVEGGVYRFASDTFFGGGRWPLLSCFLGLAYEARGDYDEATRLLNWAASTATDTGMLPEQVDGHLLAPEYREKWLQRWGPVATPLLWSHAMVLRLAAELGVEQEECVA